MGHLLRRSVYFPEESLREYFNPDWMKKSRCEGKARSLSEYYRLLKHSESCRSGTKINPHQLVLLARVGMLGCEFAQSRFVYIKRHDLLD